MPPSGKRFLDYSKFNYDTVRLYFDILHGIEKKANYPTVLEFLIFLGHDGALDIESSLEEEAFVNWDTPGEEANIKMNMLFVS